MVKKVKKEFLELEIKDIKVNSKNPRRHNKLNINMIKKSINTEKLTQIQNLAMTSFSKILGFSFLPTFQSYNLFFQCPTITLP